MTPRHLLMGVALAGAAALVLLDGGAPDSGVAEAVERRPAAPGPQPQAAAPAAGEPAIARLIGRAELLGEDGDGGRDGLFASHDWTPPPPPPPPQAAVPPAPSPPPLPFTYLGKVAGEGSWEVFLARADKTYVVRAKTVIDGAYRIDAIAPPTMTLTYLPLNQVQQLNIGVSD